MPDSFPTGSFRAAYLESRKYPSKGRRAQYGGVPSRPTLARYSTTEAIGVDPGGGDHLKSANMRVLATVVQLAGDTDRSIAGIRQGVSEKDDLRIEAQETVLREFPDAAEVLPPNTFHSANHTFDTMTAISATRYDIDPIHAIRAHLDGETRYR